MKSAVIALAVVATVANGETDTVHYTTEGTCGGNSEGAVCQFPFEYEGVVYNECTTEGHDQPWCYTDKADGKWGNCNCSECKYTKGKFAQASNKVAETLGNLVRYNSYYHWTLEDCARNCAQKSDCKVWNWRAAQNNGGIDECFIYDGGFLASYAQYDDPTSVSGWKSECDAGAGRRLEGANASVSEVAERLGQMGILPSEEAFIAQRRAEGILRTAPPAITTCGGKKCKAVYSFKGTTYTGCTITGVDGRFHRKWCKTEGGEGWITDDWGYCDQCTNCDDSCLQRFYSFPNDWERIGNVCQDTSLECSGCDKCVQWSQMQS